MPYQDYEDHLSALEAEVDIWYDVVQLIRVIHTIRSQNLSTHTGRLQAHGMLNQAVVQPFSADVRFPERRRFVREMDQPWLGLFTQLRAALLASDRDVEVVGAGAHTETRFRANQDSSRAITGALDSVLMNLQHRSATYDQRTFERRHNLVWVDEYEFRPQRNTTNLDQTVDSGFPATPGPSRVRSNVEQNHDTDRNSGNE